MYELPVQSRDIGISPLHQITREHGEIGLMQRFFYEINKQKWPKDIQDRVYAAESIAVAAHQEDMRGDHTYLTHLLRVAIRIISEDHFNIRNPDLVIAALLHDTIEDHAAFYQKLVPPSSEIVDEREYALSIIEEKFGSSIAQIVKAVTNPEWPEGIAEEKNDQYQEHVRSVLSNNSSNEMAGIIKLSDFIDNCSGQVYNEDLDLAWRLTTKYAPLIPDFKIFVRHSTIIPEDRKTNILDQLSRTQERSLNLQAENEVHPR